jgi:hypothetical protein
MATSRNVTVAKVQAAKRILSLKYFVFNQSAPFYIYMNSDTFLWVHNLKYLLNRVIERNLSGSSNFVWGNCMFGGTPFFQGGSYFISRKSAELLTGVVDRWFEKVTDPEDFEFTSALESIGVDARSGNSEFILGQYMKCEDKEWMDKMDFRRAPDCAKVELGSDVCGAFLAPFNRVVLVHRLWMCKFEKPPVPVYKYPANLYWTMGKLYPTFCIKSST